jgi:hypothetical protein
MSVFPSAIKSPELISVVSGGGEMAFDNLDGKELQVFDRDLKKIFGYYALARELRDIFLEDRDIYLYTACVAKKALGVRFGGAVPGSGEFGMAIVRPKLILGADSWFRSITSSGWQNYFGSSGSPVDFSTTSTTYGNPQNRVLAVFPKLVDFCLPKVGEVWFHVRTTDYPIWSVRFMQVSNVYVANLPAAPLIVKNGQFYMRANIDARGVNEGLALGGLMFATAEYLAGSGQE